MFIVKWVAGFLAGVLAVVATGCTAPAASQSPSVIVVANYPLEYLASRLAPFAQVVNLTPPGTEPHDLELSAQQVQSISTAAVVVYTKGFQPAVDQAIATAAPKVVADASYGIELAPLTDTPSSQLDPHLWLDPTQYDRMADNVAAAIIKAFPDKDTAVADALAKLSGDLDQLDGDINMGLSTCAIRTFVTTHAAFGYLAKRYELTQVAIDGLDPTTEPSAAWLAEVQGLIVENKVSTVFVEPLASPAAADQIARDLGLTTDMLDPIEGITSASRGSDYFTIMRANLTALKTANGCS